MPKTEEGDFELLIGNKQLLTVFFVVVILLGVFFTMGYIVGKNSVVAGDAGTGVVVGSAALEAFSLMVDPDSGELAPMPEIEE